MVQGHIEGTYQRVLEANQEPSGRNGPSKAH
jgi:hypothetical protein